MNTREDRIAASNSRGLSPGRWSASSGQPVECLHNLGVTHLSGGAGFFFTLGLPWLQCHVMWVARRLKDMFAESTSKSRSAWAALAKAALSMPLPSADAAPVGSHAVLGMVNSAPRFRGRRSGARIKELINGFFSPAVYFLKIRRQRVREPERDL